MVVATALASLPERFSSAVFGGAAPYLAYDQKTQELDDREADEREKEGISRTMLQRLSPPGTVITEEEFRRRSAAALSDHDAGPLCSSGASASTAEPCRATRDGGDTSHADPRCRGQC